jgi:four helix bundle protein
MTKAEHQNASDAHDRFWENGETTVVSEEPDNNHVYDLTARFGEEVIDFAKTIPRGAVTNRIISQLVGAASSVGANYVEADDAVSKKEFLLRIGTCRKEARETKHFLRMSVRACAGIETPGSKALDGSKRAELNFLQNLEEREMMFIAPWSFVIRASSFIRHCPHA